MQHRMLVSSCAIAVSFTWAVEDLLYVPLLIRLGTAEHLCSNIFLSNALLGLIVTPILAARSDNMGRRWPFLLSGAVCAAACSLALAVLIARAAHEGRSNSRLQVLLTFVFAGLIEFGVDLMLATGRALLCDCADGDEENLESSNALYGMCVNIGRLCGMIFASVVGWMLPRAESDPFRGASLLITTTVGIVISTWLAMTGSLDAHARTVDDKSSIQTGSEYRRLSVLHLNRDVQYLMLQCVAAWVSILTTGMYFTSLMQEYDVHSSSAAPFAMALQSASAIAISGILPTMNQRFGTLLVHNAALIGYCGCIVLMSLFRDLYIVVFLMVCSGFTCAVIDCNPYILCEQASHGDTTAQIVAMLDNTMNVAQILCAVGLGQLHYLLGDVSLMFRVAGLAWSFVIFTLSIVPGRAKLA